MNITIIARVTGEHKEYHEIKLTQIDLEEMIVQKAKEKGIKGYEGRMFRHLDETILGVTIDD